MQPLKYLLSQCDIQILCVHVCVCEREREGGQCVCLHAGKSVCMSVSVHDQYLTECIFYHACHGLFQEFKTYHALLPQTLSFIMWATSKKPAMKHLL